MRTSPYWDSSLLWDMLILQEPRTKPYRRSDGFRSFMWNMLIDMFSITIRWGGASREPHAQPRSCITLFSSLASPKRSFNPQTTSPRIIASPTHRVHLSSEVKHLHSLSIRTHLSYSTSHYHPWPPPNQAKTFATPYPSRQCLNNFHTMTSKRVVQQKGTVSAEKKYIIQSLTSALFSHMGASFLVYRVRVKLPLEASFVPRNMRRQHRPS